MRRRAKLDRRTPLRRTSDRQREVDRLHALWRACLLARDGHRCSAIGMGGIRCGRGLQAHHIYGKGAWPALRFHLENGLISCTSHHLFWIGTAPPTETGPWLERSVGKARLSRLQLRAAASKGGKPKLDLVAERVSLEQQLAALSLPRHAGFS